MQSTFAHVLHMFVMLNLGYLALTLLRIPFSRTPPDWN